MPVYIIGYDLHRSREENYDKLYTALEAVGGAYWDCLESTWLVITEKTPAQIRDELKQHLKEVDRLLVMRYGEGPPCTGSRMIVGSGSKISFEGTDTLNELAMSNLSPAVSIYATATVASLQD
jgi:hypothetical protein